MTITGSLPQLIQPDATLGTYAGDTTTYSADTLTPHVTLVQNQE